MNYQFDRLGWLGREGHLHRKSLFLDLNFWIKLSEPKNVCHEELRKLLSDLVEAGTLVCPVSPSLLMELVKRPRDTHRDSHSRLMDKLSKGLSLRGVHVIFHHEFEAALEGRQAERQVAYSDFLDAIGGRITLPVPEGLAQSEEGLELGARLVNWMSSFLSPSSITDFMNTWMEGATETTIELMRRGFSEKSQQESEWRQKNLPVPKVVEEAEFAGTFWALATEMQHVLEARYSDTSYDLGTHLEDILDTCPSFWCHYKTMAALRSNRPALEENDIWDFLHVALAVPYVDCLASDRGIRHICANVLKMDKRFGTRIISQDTELMDWLQHL